MTKLGLVLVAALNLSGAYVAQEPPVVRFPVDPTRPWVDVVYDHVGPRSPWVDGETNVGVWFILRNNSPYGISVNDRQDEGNRGSVVQFSVAPDRGVRACYDDASAIALSAELDRVRTLLKSYDFWPLDTGGLYIAPGSQMTFSVPVDAMLPYLRLVTELDVHYPPVHATSSVRTSVEFGMDLLSAEAHAQIVKAGGWAGGTRRAC